MRVLNIIGATVGVFVAASASLISVNTASLEEITQGKNDAPFFVEVVANGVPTNGIARPPSPDRRREQLVGLDLWIGANKAVEDLKKDSKDAIPFQLMPADDHDNENDALTFARSVREDPRTLAVIGHGITKTTRAAAPIYEQSGIPLIVALATGDDAVTNKDRTAHLRIAYRLSPSDGKVQAPAIAYFVRTWPAPVRQIHLFASVQDGAGEYSVPLCKQTKAILDANGFGDKTVETSVDSVPNSIDEIKRNHDERDFVIYCGYSTQANEFLAQLNANYPATGDRKAGSKPPQIILTNAVSEEIGRDAKTLSVFKMSSLDQELCADKDKLKEIEMKASEEGKRPLTPDQIRGYDAVQVIAAAARKCSGYLSRRCILDQLDSSTTFPSVCSDYQFRDGENFMSDYYVFSQGNSANAIPWPSQGTPQANAVTLTAAAVQHMLRALETSSIGK